MALGYQARAMQAGLALLGEASLLDGVACGNVVLERSVELGKGDMDRAEDNHMAQADVMTLARTLNARVGQRVTHPSGTFRLSRRLADNGVNVRFVVTEVTP